MSSNNTSNLGTCRVETYLTSRGAVEAVQIAGDLIAFYPQPIYQPQPYVILLNPASGILKRLELQSTDGALYHEAREFASRMLVEDVKA